MKFQEIALKKELIEAITDSGFKEMTPIQEKVIPLALKEKSLIGQSKTGSGKTLAFLLPIFNKIDILLNEVQALICAPTRELATQIYNVANYLASFFDKPIDIRLYSGGTDRLKELNKLNDSQPQIVIGTPGKIKDLSVKMNKLKIYTSKVLVIDEADMSFEIGFLDELDSIAGTLKNPQIMVFSATMNEEVKNFIFKYIESNEYINIENTVENKIGHILVPLKSKDRDTLFLNIIKSLNPYLALIFANTKNEVELVSQLLRDNGYKVSVIHGGLTIRERKRVMNDVHNLKYQYVVASDIAARGIDILGVSHIINYNLPKDFEFYIHRTGRTGRAEMDGIAISICDFKDEVYLTSLEKKGITFKYKDVVNNQFVDCSVSRGKREKPVSKEYIQASKYVKKDKKVTPGYKKKRKIEIEKLTKQLRRKK